MRFLCLGTFMAALQHVTCSLTTTTLLQKERISFQLRFPRHKSDTDIDTLSSPIASYELNPSDNGVSANSSDYLVQPKQPPRVHQPRIIYSRKWYEKILGGVGKRKTAATSGKPPKRTRNSSREVSKRSRISKTRWRGEDDKSLRLRTWSNNYNKSEERLLLVVSPYPVGIMSLQEPGVANFSDYMEKLNNETLVLSSESVVTDYDYGFFVNKGFRSNTAAEIANNNSGSGGYVFANDATSHLADSYRWGFLSLFLLVLMGGLGNILVCLSICLERRLQNVTNYFLLSLAIADLLVCVAVMPFSIGDAFYGHWPFGWHLCSFWVSCDVLSCSSSILHMCVVSVGRYMGIRNPLKTRSRASGKRTALVKIALVWLASCAIASPIAVLALLDPTNIQPRDDLCAINNRFFFVFGSLFAFYAPMLVMVTSYALTVHLLRKKAQFCQMENVCSSATIVGGGTTGKVSLTTDEVDTCLRCGERTNVSGGTAGGQPKPSTWKILMLAKRSKRKGKKNSKVNRGEITEMASNITVDGQTKRSGKNGVEPLPESKALDAETDFVTLEMEEALVCHYCGSTRISRSGSSNSKERLRFPSTFLRSRKRSSPRSSSTSFESPIASTSGSNSIMRKISTSSKHENGKTTCGKESFRIKGGATMFRVLGSTTRAQVHNEQKATKVLGLVFFAFVVCWSPFFVLNILFAISGPDSLPEYLATTFLWLGYVSSTINPLIYTAFNRTFRRAFWKLLTCGKCGSGGTGFSSTYVGSRMERGFRATTSSSVNVKHRIEWGSELVKRMNETEIRTIKERTKFGSEKTLEKGTRASETEVTKSSRYVYRGSGSEKTKRRRKSREKYKSAKYPELVTPELTSTHSCECRLCEFQSDDSECRSEPNFSVPHNFGGVKQNLVKSLSTSCAEEIQLAAEEDRARQHRGRRVPRSDTETRVTLSVEDFGSFKGRKQATGRKRQQLRLTSQKEKKSDRSQTFC